MLSTQIWLWGGFALFILAMQVLLFNVGITLFHPRGQEAGLELAVLALYVRWAACRRSGRWDFCSLCLSETPPARWT